MWNHLYQTKPSVKLERIALYFLECRKNMLIQMRKREQQDCTWSIQSPEFLQFFYHRWSFITSWIFTYDCTAMPASSYISTPLVKQRDWEISPIWSFMCQQQGAPLPSLPENLLLWHWKDGQTFTSHFLWLTILFLNP